MALKLYYRKRSLLFQPNVWLPVHSKLPASWLWLSSQTSISLNNRRFSLYHCINPAIPSRYDACGYQFNNRSALLTSAHVAYTSAGCAGLYTRFAVCPVSASIKRQICTGKYSFILFQRVRAAGQTVLDSRKRANSQFLTVRQGR